MAVNTGEGFRIGSMRERSQFFNTQTGLWAKRNTQTGRIMDQKADGTPFRGVAKEPDGRR